MKSNGKSQFMKMENVAPCPVLIQGRLKNVVDQSEDMRLAWFQDGQWKFRIADRGEIADARSIVKLADKGFPVNSATALKMVQYLADFEAVNSPFLPQAIVTHRLGWQGQNGKGGFLWGKNLITAEGKLFLDMRVENMLPEKWPQSLVLFRGRDNGEDQIASAFHKKGEFEKWIKAVSLVKKFPLVTFAIYASLSAPLFPILRVQNFIVDWAYPTSRGKTTTLKVAASCWGNPDEKAVSSVVKSWDATRVWLERSSSVLHSHPLIIDDTKRAKDSNLVTQFIYDYASGQGRGRGSIQGIRETSSWIGIALTCGESKITNFSAGDGGAHARVLSLWGSPFGKRMKRKAELIRKIVKLIHRNYGHAGYKFVKFLTKNRDRWSEWRRQFRELTKKYEEEAGSNEVALRQASYLALIHMTAILAQKALNLPIDYEKHLEKIAKKTLAETSEADKAKEARESVFSWMVSNKDSFWSVTGNAIMYQKWE